MNLGLENIITTDGESFSFESLLFENTFSSIITQKLAQREATENIITLIQTCGKTDTIDTYLKKVVSDLQDIDLKNISQEDLLIALNDNLVKIDKDLDAAYEGWINNVVQKIKHAFKADSKVAAMINDSIKKWESVDAETFENKVIDFKLIKAEALSAGVVFLTEVFKMLKEEVEMLAEANKWFRGSLTKDQATTLLNKIKSKHDAFLVKRNAKIVQFNNLLTHKRVKGKTYKEAGYTKQKVISVLKSYSANVAGLLKQIKDLTNLIWDVGSKLKVDVGIAVDSQGQVSPVLYIYKEVKSQFRALYGFTDDAYHKYLLIDYFMYRLAKEA